MVCAKIACILELQQHRISRVNQDLPKWPRPKPPVNLYRSNSCPQPAAGHTKSSPRLGKFGDLRLPSAVLLASLFYHDQSHPLSDGLKGHNRNPVLTLTTPCQNNDPSTLLGPWPWLMCVPPPLPYAIRPMAIAELLTSLGSRLAASSSSWYC